MRIKKQVQKEVEVIVCDICRKETKYFVDDELYERVFGAFSYDFCKSCMEAMFNDLVNNMKTRIAEGHKSREKKSN